MPIGFGVTLLQVGSYRHLREDALFAESLELRTAWVFDHFALPTLQTLEAWTALAALAVDTTRIRLGTLVTNAAFRNAAMLAKEVLTVDEISGGRVDVAVGAGNTPAEHDAIGIDFLDPRGRVERLGEVVEILDRGLRGETVSVAGRHSPVTDARFTPAPTQTPRPRLYVAAHGPKAQRIAVAHADAVTVLSPRGLDLHDSVADFRRRMEQLDRFCTEAERDPASLGRLYSPAFTNEPVFESNDSAADFIGRFVEAGATEFAFLLASSAQEGPNEVLDLLRTLDSPTLERLAGDVFPSFT